MVGSSLKTEKEIKAMIEGGKRLAKIRDLLVAEAKPGVKTIELNQLAEKEISKAGGESSFKTVKGYRHAICVSINEEVVHGIPSDRKIKEGDIIGIDVGIIYKGLHTDTAWTVQVEGKKLKEKKGIDNFLRAGEKTLEKAIKAVKIGKRIGHISKTINNSLSQAGYTPVKVLTGHGVGRSLHEEPAIPQVLLGRLEETPKIEPGMTLAIEVIYNRGTGEVFLKKDGWTIVTQDGKISATFEKSIAVSNNGVFVLTP